MVPAVSNLLREWDLLEDSPGSAGTDITHMEPNIVYKLNNMLLTVRGP